MEHIPPLKAYRARERLTQLQLAELLNVTRPTVARWEIGSRKIDPDLVPKISEITGIPKRELRPDLAELINGAAA